VYIGVDKNIDQCTASYENVVFAGETHAIHIINADVTCEFNTSLLYHILYFFSYIIGYLQGRRQNFCSGGV